MSENLDVNMQEGVVKSRTILKLFVLLTVAVYWKPALSKDVRAAVQIEISALQDVVPSGSPVKVKAEITNLTSRAIKFARETLASEIEVRDRTGTLLQTTEKYRQSLSEDSLRRNAVEVPAGETMKWVFDLSKMYDLSTTGRYSVQIRWPGGSEFVYPPAVSNIIIVKITPPTTAAAEPPAGPTASFSLEIDAPQDVVKSGSPMDIDIFATNATDHDLNLDNSLELYSIDVRDQSQKEPPITEAGKLLQRLHGKGSGNYVPVKAGKVTGMGVLPISQLYDFGQPGEYTVQIARIDEATKTLVKSNTATITVKPKSK